MSSRPEGKIRDIVEKMFHTRFWDHGKCAQCKAEATGIFGPEGMCDMFYCKACWVTYLKGTDSDDWKQWIEWQPAARASVSDSRQSHEIKCALLALAKAGGSMSFPCSSWARYMVHKFCEEEPELSCLTHKSYGEAEERFVRVTTKDSRSACEEARAVLATDLGAMDLDQLRAMEQQFALGLARVQQEIAKKGGKAEGIVQDSGSNCNCENLQEKFASLTIAENVKGSAEAISPPKERGQPMPPPKAKAVPAPPKAKAQPAPPHKAKSEPTPPPEVKVQLSAATMVAGEELCQLLQAADGLTGDYPALSNDFPSLASAGKKGGKAVPTPTRAKAEPVAPPKAKPTPSPKAKVELSPANKNERMVTDEELCQQLQMADGLASDYPALSNDFPSLAGAGKKGGKKKR